MQKIESAERLRKLEARISNIENKLILFQQYFDNLNDWATHAEFILKELQKKGFPPAAPFPKKESPKVAREIELITDPCRICKAEKCNNCEICKHFDGIDGCKLGHINYYIECPYWEDGEENG